MSKFTFELIGVNRRDKDSRTWTCFFFSLVFFFFTDNSQNLKSFNFAHLEKSARDPTVCVSLTLIDCIYCFNNKSELFWRDDSTEKKGWSFRSKLKCIYEQKFQWYFTKYLYKIKSTINIWSFSYRYNIEQHSKAMYKQLWMNITTRLRVFFC